ncbi:MAG: hypothetical protein SPE10_07660 [Paludibacteraceae bacterium]|nr:hypothetical protein [Paludibacteraceae bacterium]
MKNIKFSTICLLTLICVVSTSCATPPTDETADEQLPAVEAQDTNVIELTNEVMKSGLKAVQSIFQKINDEVSENSHIDQKPRRNIQWFELSTPKGIVKLHTYMPKDSVQILMGRPHTTSIRTYGDDVHEEWEYKKRAFKNNDDLYTTEFRFEFVNGELRSVSQY